MSDGDQISSPGTSPVTLHNMRTSNAPAVQLCDPAKAISLDRWINLQLNYPFAT